MSSGDTPGAVSGGPPPQRYSFRRHPLLGTVVEVTITVGSETQARLVADAAFSELERLEDVFSAFRVDSELSRWKRDELGDPSPEFCEVMGAALEVQLRSTGAFNPMVGVLTALWAEAERSGRCPSDAELQEAARSIVEPRYEVRDGRPRRVGDCAGLSLNAIAKGDAMDRAVRFAMRVGEPRALVVNAGGDLAHLGDRPVRVGIENPRRPYDNEPPIAWCAVQNAGLATSGGARRGFRVGGRRFSHVIDPRTGHPVDSQASISVIATSAREADVLATVAGVMGPTEAVVHIDGEADAACLVVGPNGAVWPSSRWADHALDSTSE